MGKKILFAPVTSSSIAHIIRCFAIADEMKKRGYEVFFTSCNKKDKFIENYGYNVVKTYDEINVNDPKDQSVNFLRDKKDLFVNWFKTEIEATEEVKPDVVVMAPAIFGPYIHYATGVPVVTVMDIQYLGYYSKGLMGLSRSTDRVGDKIITTVLRPLFERGFIKQYLSEVNDIYSKIGIKSNAKSRYELYNPMSVLIPSDEYTQPLRRRWHDMEYSGALFWEGFEEIETDLTEDFLKKFKGDRKLVYLTFGGSVFDKRVYESVMKPLLKSKYKVLVTLGPNFDRKEFPEDSDELLIRNLVPGMRVSKFSDVIVNTGSQGAVMQGLWWGKPQVAVPTIMDQAYYANRLVELGAGINANPVGLLKFSKRENFSNVSEKVSDNIIDGVNRILQNGKYTHNADRVKKLVRKYKNPAKIAGDFIEKHIKK